MKTTIVDIGKGEIDIYVEGQKVLNIGQVSDDDTINLFLYPKPGSILRSIMHEDDPNSDCTHELLVPRFHKE